MRYDASEQLTVDAENTSQQGVYNILRGIDSSVRELKEDFYDYRRNNDARISRMEEELSSLKREVTDLKISAGVTEHRLTELKGDVKDLRQEVNEIHGDVKALSAQLSTLQSKLGLYVSLLGIGVSVVLVLFQMFAK